MNLVELHKVLIALLHSLNCRKDMMMAASSLLTTETQMKTMIQGIINHQNATESELMDMAEKISEAIDARKLL